MTDRYEVEALLRPPVELYSAVIAGAAAAALLAAPHLMLMPPAVAWPAAAGLLVLVVRPRLRDGLAVIAYQASLKRLPTWRLKPRRIPVSKRRLFLGRGFARWFDSANG